MSNESTPADISRNEKAARAYDLLREAANLLLEAQADALSKDEAFQLYLVRSEVLRASNDMSHASKARHDALPERS